MIAQTRDGGRGPPQREVRRLTHNPTRVRSALNSAVVYLTLGLLLAQLSTPMRLKAYFLAIATFLTVLVGVSRVFLGVHYPSDVIAGWAAGAAGAGICWLVARRLRCAGSIESIR
jgi:undecaprenyl-diphosphatase